MAQIILDSNNNLIQGDFDNATLNNRTKFRTTTTNATTNVYVVPNGTSTSAGVSISNNSNLTNASKIVMATNGTTDTQIISGVNGSGTYLPLSFYVNNALAMQINSTGVNAYGGGAISTNTALGASALVANTSGSFNTAIGGGALSANTTGTVNIAIGSNALLSNLGANDNVAIGGSCMQANTSGASNVAIGRYTLFSNTTGSNSVAIGANALFFYTGANGHVAVGSNAGSNLTGGQSGVYLGNGTQAGSTTASNEIAIGINVTGKGTNTAFISANGGPTYNGANSTSWATTSDLRIKKNITPLTGSLDKIVALNPVAFDYKEDDKHEIGFIAQEYETVLPDQIITHEPNAAQKEWVGDDKVKAIQQNLVPYLVKAIQELTERVKVLENK